MHGHDPGGVPMLDIGGDVGAIVARLDGTTATGELHARPLGRHDHGFHTGVHHRRDGGRTGFVAVFPEVVAGGYELLRDDGTVWATVDVRGGEVSELTLSGSGGPARPDDVSAGTGRDRRGRLVVHRR
jgi:hypothetical protein